jgi:hypothetical protein
MSFAVYNLPYVFVQFQFPAVVSSASFLQSHAEEL